MVEDGPTRTVEKRGETRRNDNDEEDEGECDA